MWKSTCEVAFTPAVKAQQELRGSRAAYARLEQRKGWADRVTPELAAFIAERDSFYIATANARGQPYIQHAADPRDSCACLMIERWGSRTIGATASTSPPAT